MAGVIVAGLAAPGSAAASPSYERFVSPKPLRAPERRTLRRVRSWAQQRQLTLRYDPRLARAANRALDAVFEDGGDLDIEALETRVRMQGSTDGQLAAVAVQSSSTDELNASLVQQLDERAAGLNVNRVGLAQRTRRGRTSLLLLFSRRWVHLWPTPARVKPGARLDIGGTLARSLPAGAGLTVAVGRPGQTVERRSIPRRGRRFSHTLRVGPLRGVVAWQLLIDRGAGPEVAAEMNIGVGQWPWQSTGDFTLPQLADEALSAEAALAGHVLAIREAHGAGLIARSGALADAARAHSREMDRLDYFAHVSPHTGDVTARLARRRVRYSRALENIGQADSVEGIVRAWMASASHRKNLLDPEVEAFGVGVTSEGSGSLTATVVLARLADHGDSAELTQLARERIVRARADLGLTPLNHHPELDRLARRHCQEIAGGRGPDPNSPVRGPIVDTVFRELDVGAVAADVYLLDSVEAVGTSRHLAESFELAGVGVHRDAGRAGPQIWVTVIYAAH